MNSLASLTAHHRSTPAEPRRIRALFFTRGRGFGHALRDLSLARLLKDRSKPLEVFFASYSTGAEILHKSEFGCMPMDVPAGGAFVAAMLESARILAELRPDVVVSHEEFGAVVASKLAAVPCIYLSSWIPAPGTVGADALTCASRILISGEAGLFPIASNIRAEPRFLGALVRDLVCQAEDRDKLRAELGLEATFAVTIMTGGWAHENRIPIGAMITSAYAKLPMPNKRLIWIANDDLGLLRSQMTGMPGVEIIPSNDTVERYICASDVVITKANRGVTMEAAEFGVPTISLSFGNNRVDDTILQRVPSNIALNATATTPEVLCDVLTRVQSGDYNRSRSVGQAADRRRRIADTLYSDIQAVVA